MSICPVKFVPHEMKTTRITIFSYQNKLLRGILYNPYFEEGVVFENVMQFLSITEELLDSLYFPQRSMELRQFSNGETVNVHSFEAASPNDFDGMVPIATFEVNVIFRQNASWQGNIIWLDKTASASFRSFMELLMLIDSVLTKDKI